jgi:hypothetical protein
MMPPELRALMERYCQLARLLPQEELDLDPDDPGTRAEAEMVLKEMALVQARIDAMLDAAACERNHGCS